MVNNDIKVKISNTSNQIIKIAGIVGAFTIIAGGYTWYLNNIWKPKIEVVSVDFVNGVASLKHKNDMILLDGDAVYWINADWGIRFGTTRSNGETIYNRIELLKKGMVVEYINRN